MSDDTRERSSDAARDASAPPNGSDGNQTMLQPDGHLDAEMVSAWLDSPEDFNEHDRLAIETHLADCRQCREVAAELTAIVRAFQTLPLVEAQRSFGLTPEMAGLTRTPTLPSSRLTDAPATKPERATTPDYVQTAWYERQMTRLRWATAVAMLLFVFVFSADLLGNIDTSGDDDDSGTFVEAPMSTGGEQEQAGAGAEATAAGAAMPEEEEAEEAEEDAAGDVARQQIEATEAAGSSADEAAGSGLAATETSGEADEEDAAPPTDGAEEPAADDAETLLTMETAETTDAEQESAELEPAETEPVDLAQESDETMLAYSEENTVAENQESNTLHLIELALVIVIGWLIVAMIALPRLRRPSE